MQIKVYSVLLGKAREMGFVIPDDRAIGLPEGVKYEGATVLQAQRGAYFEVVSALDFASLYPSIIRAHNMCYSTLVMDDEPDSVAAAAEAAAAGALFHQTDTAMGTFRFAQQPRGVVPALLEDLAEFRKAAKRDMAAAKAAGDDWGAALANAKQNAYKITMNSVYGFLGATKGFLPIVPIAASVTATGRDMIQKTKALVESLAPGSRVVYGDTVSCRTAVVAAAKAGSAAARRDSV